MYLQTRVMKTSSPRSLRRRRHGQVAILHNNNYNNNNNNNEAANSSTRRPPACPSPQTLPPKVDLLVVAAKVQIFASFLQKYFC